MQATLDRYIDTSPDIRGGKARIAGTRIAVSDVILMHLRLGQSLEQIAARYDLSLAALHAAMAFYYDNQVDVDRCIDNEDAFVQAARQNKPSLLQAKLKALNGG